MKRLASWRTISQRLKRLYFSKAWRVIAGAALCFAVVGWLMGMETLKHTSILILLEHVARVAFEAITGTADLDDP